MGQHESKIKLSKADLMDLNNVSLLFDKYRIFYGQNSDLQAATHFIHDRISNKESVIFLASEERDSVNYPVGFVQLYPSFSSVSMKRVWILNDLYVDETSRRQGIAEILMARAKEFAQETGAKGITLCTAIDNIPAQKLYEKLGYVKNKEYFYYHLFFKSV